MPPRSTRPRRRHGPALIGLLFLAFDPGSLRADAATGRRFIAFTDTRVFGTSTNQDGAHQLLSSPVSPGFAWDELVLSWNADVPDGTWLRLEAQPHFGDRPGAFYTLGWWSGPGAAEPRRSVNGQRDADAEVKTDVLALARPANAARVRITLGHPPEVDPPRVRFLGLAFLNRGVVPPPQAPDPSAWGRTLDVPTRSQLDYEGGDAWCSPTSLSMLLTWWARRLDRPELDRGVPDVAAGVHDPNWPGTGNWPFNTAYAGGLPGLRGYVTRLSGVPELEAWIRAGVPVATSINYSTLKGRTDASDGHLVVCVGFAPNGDVVLNDPGTRKEMRKTVQRDRFAAAWAESHNTVYLVHPEALRPPPDRFGHWHAPAPAPPGSP